MACLPLLATACFLPIRACIRKAGAITEEIAGRLEYGFVLGCETGTILAGGGDGFVAILEDEGHHSHLVNRGSNDEKGRQR